jgi:hypothetical protein
MFRNFLVAYGFLWFVTMIVAKVTWSYIKLGSFGYIGFPIIAIFYALFVRSKQSRPSNYSPEFALFAQDYPNYKELPHDEQAVAFANWRDHVRAQIKAK